MADTAGVIAYCKQLLETGNFHADPHPGTTATPWYTEHYRVLAVPMHFNEHGIINGGYRVQAT